MLQERDLQDQTGLSAYSASLESGEGGVLATEAVETQEEETQSKGSLRLAHSPRMNNNNDNDNDNDNNNRFHSPRATDRAAHVRLLPDEVGRCCAPPGTQSQRTRSYTQHLRLVS